MRSLMILGMLGSLISASLKAQDLDCSGWIKPWGRKKTFIPQFTCSYFGLNNHFKFNEFTKPESSSVIFKSPVKHEAFFCRLEDLSVKKFGIMFQFHLGDYNSSRDRIIPR